MGELPVTTPSTAMMLGCRSRARPLPGDESDGDGEYRCVCVRACKRARVHACACPGESTRPRRLILLTAPLERPASRSRVGPRRRTRFCGTQGEGKEGAGRGISG